MELFILFIVCLAFGAVTALIASGKGREWPGWFAFGFFFPVLGMFAAMIVPDVGANNERSAEYRARKAEAEKDETLHQKRLLELQVASGAASDAKVCPQCAETVKRAAKICRYCRFEFPEASGSATPYRFGAVGDNPN